jgi:hypothetical protein
MVIDLYRVKKAGMVWRRVQRRGRNSEQLLQEALQAPANLHILGMGRRRIRWIGREFQSADFFGIDEKWNLVFVETKVSSQQAHLAQQLRTRVGRFVGMDFRKVDTLIRRYVHGQRDDSFLMAEGLRLRRLDRKERLQRDQDVAIQLRRHTTLRRPSRVRRVRFVAVSPIVTPEFARALRALQLNLKRRLGRRGFLSFTCVLLLKAAPDFDGRDA